MSGWVKTSDSSRQVGVVSIALEGYPPQEVASLLDSAFSVQVRAGFQCAPGIHQALGTDGSGGTVRLSLGALNTMDDVSAAIDALAEVAASAP